MEEFNKRKKHILIGAVTLIFVFLAIVIFLFKDEIIQSFKEWRASKSGSTEEVNYGDINIEEEPTTEEPEQEPEKHKDSLGIEYKEYKFITNNYSFSVPDEWIIEENNGIITSYYDGEDENYKYKDIQIVLVPCCNYLSRPEDMRLLKLRNDSLPVLRTRV